VRSDRLTTITLTQAFLGLETEAKFYDVWKGRKEHKLTAAAAIEIDVNPDGVLFLRCE
jgi:hypothetical protein